jgi:transposase
LRPDPRRLAAAGRRGGADRLDPPLRGQHRRPVALARRRGKRGDPEALGRSRGGFSTKLHLRAERGGKPVIVVLTCGERHEQSILPALMEGGAVKRAARGSPRIRLEGVAGDKGYSSRKARHFLRGRRIAAVIPTKADQGPLPNFDRAAYRERNVVERLINRVKQFLRVAMRYEKRAANYLAMVTIAAILLWL